MKTTTTKSAAKKLELLVSECRMAKNAIVYKELKKVTEGETKIRPVYLSGSGRHTSNQDNTEVIKKNLTKLGIEFTFSNDSPRGGLTGNLITITTKVKTN